MGTNKNMTDYSTRKPPRRQDISSCQSIGYDSEAKPEIESLFLRQRNFPGFLDRQVSVVVNDKDIPNNCSGRPYHHPKHLLKDFSAKFRPVSCELGPLTADCCEGA